MAQKFWGVFKTEFGERVNLELDLDFTSGQTVSGSFTATPPVPAKWRGPTSGELTGSLNGKSRFELTYGPDQKFGSATLSGKLEEEGRLGSFLTASVKIEGTDGKTGHGLLSAEQVGSAMEAFTNGPQTSGPW